MILHTVDRHECVVRPRRLGGVCREELLEVVVVYIFVKITGEANLIAVGCGCIIAHGVVQLPQTGRGDL